VIIDVHGHYIPPAMLKPVYRDLFDVRVTERGKRIFVKGADILRLDDGLMEINRQVANMDRCGVGMRLLSVPPFTFLYEAEIAAEWSRDFNDAMLRDASSFKSRFRLLATLPMMQIGAAVDELVRVMADPVFAGAEIATNISGMDLDDQALYPFWERAEKLGAFILIHPHYYFAEKRLHRKYLQNMIGNPLENILAAFNLMAGGILERFPGLKICLCHGGGYLAYGVARLNQGFRVREELADMACSPGELVRRFYVDSILHDRDCLEFLIRRMGADRVLMGSDYPFDFSDTDPVRSVNAVRIGEADRQAILGGNVKSLLPPGPL